MPLVCGGQGVNHARRIGFSLSGPRCRRDGARFHWMRIAWPRYRSPLLMDTWLFWALAVVAIVASLLVVSQRSVRRGVLTVVVLLGAMSGLYLLLSAPFAAIIQLTLYAGALTAVILPVTFLLDLPDDADEREHVGPGAGSRRAGVLLVVALVVELAWAFQRLRGVGFPQGESLPGARPTAVMTSLLFDHGAGIAIVALLMLVVIAGAMALVRRESR
jgi:NADH-quinone oxidoreductase subunit J